MNNVRENLEMNDKRRSEDGLNIKKIVVAVDLSSHSERTAAYAANFAKRFNASMTLVHVCSVEPVRTLNTFETHKEKKRHNIERKLSELVKKICATYPNCDMWLCNGDPAEQISLLAQDLHADLIITASCHPSFLSRLFGWGEAPRIVDRARCPVLVCQEGMG